MLTLSVMRMDEEHMENNVQIDNRIKNAADRRRSSDSGFGCYVKKGWMFSSSIFLYRQFDEKNIYKQRK